MLEEKFRDFHIVCGSASPRRQYLLKELGLDFEIRIMPVEEDFPGDLKQGEIPMYLSKLKADALKKTLREKELIITADTIVWLEDKAMNKPADRGEAIGMIRSLSGKMHQVFTGVTITSMKRTETFYAETKVYFRKLSEAEITYYIDRCKPFDKAGAYGAQEWIGYTGIEKIEGTYFNVMGLPLAELYQVLMENDW